jgi:hypothetical protein
MFETGLLNLTNWTGNVIMPTLAGLFFAAAIYRFSKAHPYSHLSWAGFAALMCSGLLRVIEGFAQQAGPNEAQAFKRACSCFGLGRYLYYFDGTWVDLDERKRPTTTPQLAGWATPEGWREGLRPQRADNQTPNTGRSAKRVKENQVPQRRNVCHGQRDELIRQIEAMAEPLGKALYRGLLKTVARVWSPGEVHDAALLQKVLVHMQSATRGLRRLEAALEQTGPKPLPPILRSLDLNSLSQINTLEALHEIVVALEAKVCQ